MTWLDFLILGLIVGGVVYGIAKGLVHGVLKILAVLISYLIAVRMSIYGTPDFAASASHEARGSGRTFMLVLGVAIVVTWLLSGLVARVLTRGKPGASGRLLGALAGLVLVVVVLCIALSSVAIFIPSARQPIAASPVAYGLVNVSSRAAALLPSEYSHLLLEFRDFNRFQQPRPSRADET